MLDCFLRRFSYPVGQKLMFGFLAHLRILARPLVKASQDPSGRQGGKLCHARARAEMVRARMCLRNDGGRNLVTSHQSVAKIFQQVVHLSRGYGGSVVVWLIVNNVHGVAVDQRFYSCL
jgi:hypothetical protein